MRSSKSRSRSKNNRNRNSLGNVVNRVFDSSGPEGKVRGTPQQIIDKYNQLARDAGLANDRVAAENFQQHAEHYMRLLSEAQREAEVRREQQERENRERQAQRDKERAERDVQKSAAREEPEEAEAPRADPLGGGDQPDVIDMGGEEAGLVETPENRETPPPAEEKPKKPRRTRKKAEPKPDPKPEPEPSAENGETPAPDAAE
ncbi:DUF4167 domain-containing protein [Salipiger sp. P9]|uniref:DUF4167 domain-containing protein n=1 Tax=Salipiger pentaromativorans TaxID=2943193 RepID=UPI0021571732|nr:DUF4167 domain-containing protein [Salipiger pentaromativorans]MCR8550226.1 DUF4167 domain-containing protein [Salipiger pentaromativorans]